MNTVINQASTTLLKTMLAFPLASFKAAGMAMFADLVKPGGDWDMKPYLRDAKTAHCPSSNCNFTVTLCDVCVRRDMPGNIFYGYIGRFLGIDEDVLLIGADLAQRIFDHGQPDPPEDQNAIRMGFCIYNKTGENVVTSDAICKCLSMAKKGLATSPDCKPCSAPFNGMLP